VNRRGFLALASGPLVAEPLRAYSFLWGNPLAPRLLTARDWKDRIEHFLREGVRAGLILPEVHSHMAGSRIITIEYLPLVRVFEVQT
jgi:hypothetical protein